MKAAKFVKFDKEIHGDKIKSKIQFLQRIQTKNVYVAIFNKNAIQTDGWPNLKSSVSNKRKFINDQESYCHMSPIKKII